MPDSKEIKIYLSDIERSIREIFDFLPEKRDFLEFQKDLKARKAIERNIEIIGEAMNRILKADNTISITNARKIVDTRNYVIHGYDTLTADILWSIVVNHLPLLKNEIEDLLIF